MEDNEAVDVAKEGNAAEEGNKKFINKLEVARAQAEAADAAAKKQVETSQGLQQSIFDESVKQTTLLASILLKPSGGVAGAGSLNGGGGALSVIGTSAKKAAEGMWDMSLPGMATENPFAEVSSELSDAQKRNKEKYGQANAGGFTGEIAGPNQQDVNAILASLGGGGGGINSPDLIEASNKIKDASEIFPKEVQMVIGDTSVNVNVNGAEVLNAIMPEVRSVVMSSVVTELVNFEKTKDQNNSPGSYANNKKAEQYAV